MIHRHTTRRKHTQPPAPTPPPQGSPKAERGFSAQSIAALFLRANRLVEGIRQSAEVQSALKAENPTYKAELNALAKLVLRTQALFPEQQAAGQALQEPTDEQRTALAELGRAAGKLRKDARRALEGQPAFLVALGIEQA